MFAKCCGCNKKEKKNQKYDSITDAAKSSPPKSETNTDMNHTDTNSKDNVSTKPATPVGLSTNDLSLSDLSIDNITTAKLQKSEVNNKTSEENTYNDNKALPEGIGSPLSPTTLDPCEDIDNNQTTGFIQQSVVSPVGREYSDLALLRHRFFSELMTQSATEHHVCFDPVESNIACDIKHQQCNHPTSELQSLIVRLERVTSQIEKSIGSNVLPESKTETIMSVAGFSDILNGTFSQYLNTSQKIGGDVAAHSQLVDKAFHAQLQYLILASQSKQPSNQNDLVALLKPTSDQISNIQNFREKNRTSPYFNHLSAISESIPALGWVTVSPAPSPYVKEMNDAGQFYTNRVLKEWKEKNKTHVEWVKSWVQTLSELQQFIKQHHTTGLVWSGKSVAPPPPPTGCPPPPPIMNIADLPPIMDDGHDRSALFAQINQGEGITKSLKKVTSEMQTHKNTTLRTGPAPFKAPTSTQIKGMAPSAPIEKPPSFTRDGKKWLIEYQKNNINLLVDNVEMNNVVYVFKCVNSTVTVKGKLNSVVMDSCKKTSVVFDSLVSSVEFINCQSVQMQVMGKVPTISVDKTDGCQMYLSPDSLDVEIISSKSSEMNVLVPKGNGDYCEYAVPEQYKTTVVPGKGLSTIVVESKG